MKRSACTDSRTDRRWLPRPLMAQQQQRARIARSARRIPADARPPKGMCRIWIDNVPAAQQPAATDCPTAVKNRPTNGARDLRR